jgi:hypothetical protein
MKMVVEEYQIKKGQKKPGLIKLPSGTQIQQETEIAPEVHSSLGILEELEPSFGFNFELDTLEEFNPEVPPRTQCVSCNFTTNCPEDGPDSQKEIMNQLGQKDRIKIIEEVSLSENSPLMMNKDTLNLQQSIHESPIPTEVLVEEDNRFESALESSKEIHLLEKNPILILPEEKKIPEKFSPVDRFHQNPKNTPHEWPHSEEAKKIKEYTSALDLTNIDYYHIKTPKITSNVGLRHPPFFETESNISIIQNKDYLVKGEALEIGSRMKANRKDSDFGIQEDEDSNKRRLTSKPVDPRTVAPIHQQFETKVRSKKKTRIRRWDSNHIYKGCSQSCEVC